MNRRAFPASYCVAGLLIVLALPLHARSEQPDQVTQAAVAAQPSQSIANDRAARSEPSNPNAAAEQGAQDIDAFLIRLDSATRAIHEGAKRNPELVREGCRAFLSEVLDLDAMTESANAEIRQSMTLSQRESFRLAFERRMIRNCMRQFGTYDGQVMQLAGVRKVDAGHLLATVRVGSEIDGRMVTWRLRNFGVRSWRAIDIITEGRSAVLDTRNELAAVLRSVNGDIEAMIAFMQK